MAPARRRPPDQEPETDHRLERIEMVRSLGADRVIDYTREDVTRGATRYDVILQLGGTRSPSAPRRILAPKGTLVLSSGAGRFAGIDRIVRALIVSPLVGQRLTTFNAQVSAAELTFLTELIESGRVMPVIDRRLPLSEAPAAIRYLQAGCSVRMGVASYEFVDSVLTLAKVTMAS